MFFQSLRPKSGCLRQCSAFVCTQKKRDCTAAVPLFEALVLPLILNKQHRSPRRYVRTHTYLFIDTGELDIHIPRTSQCCTALESKKFTRFRIAKNKALLTPFMSCNCPPERHNPKAWTHYGCKGNTFFRTDQRNAKKKLFLQDRGVFFFVIAQKNRTSCSKEQRAT